MERVNKRYGKAIKQEPMIKKDKETGNDQEKLNEELSLLLA